MKKIAQLSAFILLTISGLYGFDYLNGVAEDKAFGSAVTGAVIVTSDDGSSADVPLYTEVWKHLADALYQLYYREGKLTRGQYEKAYYALAKGEPLPEDVAKILPKGDAKSLKGQYLEGKIKPHYLYVAAYYAALYKPTMSRTPP